MKLFKILTLCSILGATAASVQAQTDNYPSKPVRMIVGYAPGGATDIAGRLMAAALTKALGQSFVVENRPGVGGLIGLDLVAKAEPDGYTLAVGTVGPLTISPELYKEKWDLNPQTVFDPVIWFANTPGIIVARPSLDIKSIDDLIKASKSKDQLNLASAGTGSIQHLMGEYFQNRMGIKWQHIPYKGSSPALVDLAAGRTDVMFDVVPSAAPYVEAGNIRPIAIASENRARQLPDVPTLKELGYEGFDLNSWWALLTPKGTPPSVIERLNTALNEALQTPEMKEQLANIGAEPGGGKPDRLASTMKVEAERWAKVIKDANVVVE